MREMAEKREQLSIYLKPSLQARIAAAAKAEHRTVSNYIEANVERYLDALANGTSKTTSGSKK
jgi:uncharacterized protein (DUF1778 family)